MNNRQILNLSAIAIAAILVLFAIKLIPNIGTGYQPEKYISPNDVKGTAVLHNGLAYTLNFEQQNTLLTYLNQSLTIGSEAYKTTKPIPFTKIILYRFASTPIEITPIAVDSNDLIYSAPLWNPNGHMRDISDGSLLKLLNSTFDQ
ncbi:MAG: hypothetical protein WC222_03005 [Parachlamydiales bacterium]|jgi:hypothetical protein